MTFVTVTTKERIVIPAEIRRKLKITDGTKLFVIDESGVDQGYSWRTEEGE